MNPQTRSRLTLVIVVLLFAIPLVAAFLLRASGWQPTNTKNSGTLIEPPRDLSSAAATIEGGARYAWKDPEYRWTLVLLPSEHCGAHCIERLDEALRMRITLGRNADRLRAAYIGPAQPADFFAQRAPLTFVNDDAGTFRDLHAHDDSLALALVDPSGLLMMRYPDGYSAQGLRSDITRILY